MKHSSIIVFLCILFCSGITFKVSAGKKDSLFVVRIDPVLEKILSLEKNTNGIKGNAQSFIQLTEPELQYRKQQIVKTNSKIYIHLDGTGILFEGIKISDTLIRFSRIENTHNINYNGSGHLFSHGENVYIYGGYGFWKSNGHLKKFNFNDKEWDIISLAKEIIPPGSYSPGVWQDVNRNRMYVLTEKPVNEAIVDFENKNKAVKSTYYLDFGTMNWIDNPPLHSKTSQLLSKGVLPMQNENGILFSSDMNVYFLDLNSNKVLRLSDKSIAQSVSRIAQQDLYFLDKNMVFFKNQETGELDSLSISISEFKEESFPIFSKHIPEYLYWSGLMVILIAFVIFISTQIDRLPNKKITIELLEQKKLEFTGIENGLIQFLINKSRKQLKADINELNYILGVKEKNIGMQKKIRSEAIKAINEKFSYLTGIAEPLVSIERSNKDKRYFEYFIQKEHIQIAITILKTANES